MFENSKEQRSEGRNVCDVDFVCHVISSCERWFGRALDVSDNGIGLTIQRKFECGTKLVISITNGPTLIAEVMRNAHTDDGYYWIHGCKILSMAKTIGRKIHELESKIQKVIDRQDKSGVALACASITRDELKKLLLISRIGRAR